MDRTTTSTTSAATSGSILIIARNSQDNQPVLGATGIFTLHQDNGQVTLTLDVQFDQDGRFILPITRLAKYTVTVKAPGFITHNMELNPACKTVSGCTIEKMVVMSPTLSPGQTRIMMSWDAEPADIDIHVMAIKKSDGSLCRTWYQHKTGCAAISQDLDNTQGGLNGAETVTLQNKSINIQYTYLIAVEDYAFENNGELFLNSSTHIAITNGWQTVEMDMEATSIQKTSEFYLFGCLQVESNGYFKFIPSVNGTFFNGDIDNQWKKMQNDNCP